ncbi:MAG: oligosaccharide flippase family protein [Clostridia bacterium]|nr:oligosaccharide flippase family protein [Clostridia bacterium]
MTSSEFGTADVLQAIVSLLLPIFSLTIYEGVFRYTMEKEYNKNAVYTVGIIISALGAIILCIIGGFLSAFTLIDYVWIVVFNSIAGFFRSLFSQYARAVDKTGLFTLDNVLLTFYVLAFNIVFIVFLNMGVMGYMLGYTVANLLSCIFLFIFLGPYRKLDFKSVKFPLFKEMLWFSIPLIPNAICWWISSFIDRIIITSVIGEAANGIYAAGHKIPSLLSVVVTIFFQAWQISANQEFKKKDISQFYTEIHDQIFAVIMLVSSGLILLCRPVTSIFLGKDYYEAWTVMPLLLIAMSFFSFAQFLGSIYSANKKTVMAFVTNFIAVIVSLGLNILLVAFLKIGIIGSAIATSIGYFVLWIIRIKSTKKIVPIFYNIKKMFSCVLLIILQAILITLNVNVLFTYIIASIITVALVIILRDNIISLINFAFSFIKKIIRKEK